jgi:hypothetical protein
MGALVTAAADRSFPTMTVTGGGEAESDFTLPYRGERLRGDGLPRKLDDWVAGGIVEPYCAQAAARVAAHPEWLSLPGRTVAFLGARSEIGPDCHPAIRASVAGRGAGGRARRAVADRLCAAQCARARGTAGLQFHARLRAGLAAGAGLPFRRLSRLGEKSRFMSEVSQAPIRSTQRSGRGGRVVSRVFPRPSSGSAPDAMAQQRVADRIP